MDGLRIVVTVALVVLASAQSAQAGRYCGSDETFSPSEGSTLPIGPTIAQHVEHAYFQGNREHSAVATKLAITLDGKPVTFKTRDVRVADGIIRYITITSKKTGTLVIAPKKPSEDGPTELATYTIAADWAAPEKPAVTVSHGLDLRLDVYRMQGHFAKVVVAAPAISFSLRWRKNAKAKWRTLTLPASFANDGMVRVMKDAPPVLPGSAQASIGERVCGMVETVPRDALDAGIEAELTAKLPDGKTLKVTELPSPLVLPPVPKGVRYHDVFGDP